jgi:hypothetical protein
MMAPHTEILSNADWRPDRTLAYDCLEMFTLAEQKKLQENCFLRNQGRIEDRNSNTDGCGHQRAKFTAENALL